MPYIRYGVGYAYAPDAGDRRSDSATVCTAAATNATATNVATTVLTTDAPY